MSLKIPHLSKRELRKSERRHPTLGEESGERDAFTRRDTVGKESGHATVNIPFSPTHTDETGTTSLVLPHSTSGPENSWK